MAPSEKIPFIDLETQLKNIRTRVDRAVQKVFDHGAFIMGPEVKELEDRLRDFSQVPHVISCSNGTDALRMALMALDLEPGDSVILPSFTFISTAEVVALEKGIPVFADIDPETYTMSFESVVRCFEQAKKEGRSIKGIITVDLFGHPSAHSELEAFAKENNLWVIVDAAQSFGAIYKGKSTVSYGTIATTSFFPAKPLGCCGDGGAIFTKDAVLAEKLKSIRVHGQGAERYTTERLGVTGRLDTLQAAILLEKLAIFPEEIAQRNKVAKRYAEGLGSIVSTPQVAACVQSVWAQYSLLSDKRDAIQAQLAAANIPSVIYYAKPLHTQKPYSHYPQDPQGLKETFSVSKRILSLPMHPYLDQVTQERIIQKILGVFA